MATAETAQQQNQTQTTAHERTDRPVRRRPFSTWMKKLANFKGSSSTTDSGLPMSAKRHPNQAKTSSKKQTTSKNNNPYPESGHINGNTGATNGNRSPSAVPTGTSLSTSSLSRRRHSVRSSEEGHSPPTIGNKSTAATVSTDVAHSEAAQSHAASSGEATTGTAGGGVSTGQGPDSTFSSPSPSIRSLTTTLTTIHSAAPATAAPPNNSTNFQNTQSLHFSHQFPTSPPPNALPPHLVPQGSGGHPATYNTATANNLLTDNASILTLASSSKRRRRRSMDTDASVRALAPSSLFGGSRESLPLSVLSANVDSNTTSIQHQQRGASGGGLNERASIYSTAGVAPVLPSERNSYYAGKPTTAADGGSVKSGLVGHGRNDSISGSIGGIGSSGSPLAASPRDITGSSTGGKLSRNNSAWADGEDHDKVDSDTAPEGKNIKDVKDSKAKENGKIT